MATIQGQITVDSVLIIECDVDPSLTAGTIAPIGSLAVDDSGNWYIKFGLSNTSWIKIQDSFFYRQTVIQTVTSSTPTGITELTSVSLPIGNYAFQVFGIFQSTATNTGIGARIGQGSSVMGSAFGKWAISQAANGTNKNYEYDQLSPTENQTSASVVSANTDAILVGSGIFNVSTQGTVQLQIRSENNGTAVSLRPGSYLKIERLP